MPFWRSTRNCSGLSLSCHSPGVRSLGDCAAERQRRESARRHPPHPGTRAPQRAGARRSPSPRAVPAHREREARAQGSRAGPVGEGGARGGRRGQAAPGRSLARSLARRTLPAIAAPARRCAARGAARGARRPAAAAERAVAIIPMGGAGAAAAAAPPAAAAARGVPAARHAAADKVNWGSGRSAPTQRQRNSKLSSPTIDFPRPSSRPLKTPQQRCNVIL